MYSETLLKLKLTCGNRLNVLPYDKRYVQGIHLPLEIWSLVLQVLNGHDVSRFAQVCRAFKTLISHSTIDASFHKVNTLRPYFREEEWSKCCTHMKRSTLLEVLRDFKTRKVVVNYDMIKAINSRPDFDLELLDYLMNEPFTFGHNETKRLSYAKLKLSSRQVHELVDYYLGVSLKDCKLSLCTMMYKIMLGCNKSIKWEHITRLLIIKEDSVISRVKNVLCHPCVPFDVIDKGLRCGLWELNTYCFESTIPIGYALNHMEWPWSWHYIIERRDITYSQCVLIEQKTGTNIPPSAMYKVFKDPLVNTISLEYWLESIKRFKVFQNGRCLNLLLKTKRLSDEDFDMLFNISATSFDISSHSYYMAITTSPSFTFEHLKRYGGLIDLPIEGLACNPNLTISEVMSYLTIQNLDK